MRKGWDALSEQYRKRLIRNGVTRQQYESGTPLSKARGHKAPTHERKQSKFYRERKAFAEDAASAYGLDPDSIREELRQFSQKELQAQISRQRRMQELYMSGRYKAARAEWEQRDKRMPQWMSFYHFLFS